MTMRAGSTADKPDGQLSTGPRTAEGKAIAARNSIKHGIFAAVPVLPGESAEEWAAHRAGVVESLAPAGLLEVNLAERAALLLWRLQRLARYEAETVAAAMEEAALPPPTTALPWPVAPPRHKTRDEQLAEMRHALRRARTELADVGLARDHLRAASEARPDGPVSFAVAEIILESAHAQAEVADGAPDPPAFGSKPFLKQIGLTGANPRQVVWTAEVIDRGLAFYATLAREDLGCLRAAIGVELDDWIADLTRQVRRLEGESTAVARLLDDGTARKQAAELLPADKRDERIVKYERHLHSLLTSTLHELERLQARRDGEAIAPPAVADVNVTVDAGAG